MQRAELLGVLNALAPLSLALPWDKSGIQIESVRKSFSHIAVALDATPFAAAKAVEIGCDFLLTHHPLTLKPRFTDVLDGYHFVLSALLGGRVLHYAAHTCLDSLPYGPTVWLADALELKKRSVLEKSGTAPDGSEAGIGCVGTLPVPLDSEVFLNVMRLYLRHPFVRIGEMPSIVQRIAICPGSGASLLDAARQAGADVYVTGDIKYHAALDANSNVYDRRGPSILDVGHFVLEEEMMRRFAHELAALLPDMRVSFIPGTEPFILDGVTNESVS
ncbi:MAG: Nif3-like dinuclear metal center hexameric protein [Mailhella sp.]|nr:Nif3-like dinuclear metal center hexameric protein [Mailhella sp.]